MNARMVIALTVLGAALCFHGRAFSEEDPSVAALRARVKEELAKVVVLNKYPYLYDEKLQEKDDLAVVFNNRCYAYMQLGELEKALEDCNKSLVYGDLPDAHRKQQELVKRIAAKGAR